MQQAPEETGLPPSLWFLKGLVIALTLTMIVGVITVVALLVTRMPGAMQAPPALPAQITLPDGSKPAAFTQTADWFAVVTTDNHILIYNRDGTLRQNVVVQNTP
ncbi:MAG: DUF6476 family protein [Paracoccaceae bacterium]